MRKRADTNKSPTEPKRRILEKETLLLWVRSGGRCAKCNDYLLEEPDFESIINLGERAHIAGWQDTPGSPRGASAVPIGERNDVENLVLLCQVCHKIVDDTSTRDYFTEERLLGLKHRHETRIRHLTEMKPSQETAVVRMLGLVRGSVPELSRNTAMQTVIASGDRYAYFPLTADRHSIEIDLSSLPDPETISTAYWIAAKSIIDSFLMRLTDGVRTKHISHLSVFAIARIPLLVYLGYAIDDKIPADLYQKHRGEGETWQWQNDLQPTTFTTRLLRDGADSTDVILIVSLSGSIDISELPGYVADGRPVYEIRPEGVAPNRDLFRSRATLRAFTDCYHDFLSGLEARSKSFRTIHLFPAAPVTAAIACGRGLMRHVQPGIRIYDRMFNTFEYALTVNEQ